MNQEMSGPTWPTQPNPAELNALIALYNAQRLAEVESRAHALLGQHPNTAILWKLLGASLQLQGKDALSAFQKAAELSQNDPEVHNNLGMILQERGQLDGAIVSYRNALRMAPGFVEAHYNLGNALSELGRLEDAVACYRDALKIDPNVAVIHSNLGATLQEMGRLDEALASCRRALELEPGWAVVHSNLLGMMICSPGHSPASCLAEAREYGRRVGRSVTSRFTNWKCSANPERLRVGVVSGDLHSHPVGFFLESLIARIDPTRIELIAYPTDTFFDALTNRIKPRFAAWKSLFNLSDADAARMIHNDGVNVLLDISGHTEQNRLPIFAWKPAPVQASWLGYFGTTGVAEMDYLLADKVCVPEEHRKDFSEAVWYLPDTRWCFTAPEVDLPVATLPALKNGYITFGCFQRLTKVGDDVLKVWGEILRTLPNAKLRWQCTQLANPTVAAQFVERLRGHGISPAQITMHGGVLREAYLAAHGDVDVILDTFPFPGGTTTCEALWMGVPTLTLAGDTLLARQGASMLSAAGLGDWVTDNVEDYIAKAVNMTRDLPKLAALRSGLRQQVSASSLFDAKRFSKNFEDALWGMWQAKAQGNTAISPRTSDLPS